jgi:lysophospholipase L1-like esterase
MLKLLWRGLALLVAVVVWALLIGEVVARMQCCELLSPVAEFRSAKDSERMQARSPEGASVPYHWLPNQERGGRRFTNNLGFVMERDVSPAKPPDAVRVLTLGASTTQASNPQESYPTALQMRLSSQPETARWEVINAGHEGYRLRHTLALFEEQLLDLEPDIVVFYGEINDLISLQFERYAADARAAERRSQLAPFVALRTFSALWRFYLGPYVNPGLPQAGGADDLDWEQALRPWESQLNELLDVADEHGIKVLLTTYAFALQDGQAPTHSMRVYADHTSWPAVKDPIARFRAGIEAENRIVQRVAEARGLPVVDAAGELTGRTYLFTDLVHFTPEGYAILADLVADGLAGVRSPARASSVSMR